MKKRSILSYLTMPGYIIIVLSLSLVVASGAMFYYYESHDQTVTETEDGQVAGKVKAAGDNWDSNWELDEFIGAYDNYEDYMIRSGGDTSPRGIITNINNSLSDSWKKVINGESILGDRVVSGEWFSENNHISSVGFPPIIKKWEVNGRVGGKSFNEEWELVRVKTSRYYDVSSSRGGHSWTAYLFTGNVKMEDNLLKYEVYHGGKWLEPRYEFSKHRWVRPGTRLYKDNRMHLSDTYHYLLSNTRPISWTITGSFN